MKNSKTVLEWFNELPEPYRTQAIENTHKEDLKEKIGSLKDAISSLFLWYKSPQGFDYWSDFNDTL